MYQFVLKGHGFLDHVWNFLFPLHTNFVRNLICFCPSLLLPVLLMKVVVAVAAAVVVVVVVVVSCLFMAVFPAGARMLAADVFLHLKSLVYMKLHTCTHTHTHTCTCTCTHEEPLYPSCHCCLSFICVYSILLKVCF